MIHTKNYRIQRLKSGRLVSSLVLTGQVPRHKKSVGEVDWAVVNQHFTMLIKNLEVEVDDISAEEGSGEHLGAQLGQLAETNSPLLPAHLPVKSFNHS